MRWLLPLALCLVACQREVPVLLYHEVGCGTQDPRDVPVDELDRELGWLAEDGRTIVPASALLEPEKLPAKPVVLTFDDGAACIYRAAFPVLRRHRAPFTVFLPSAWIAPDDAHRQWQPLGDGERVQTLVWPEVRELVESGLGTVGAHGQRHLYLRRASEEELRGEIFESKTALASKLGVPVDLFAYPFGAFGNTAVEAVRDAGYKAAFSVGAGVGGRFGYRRRSIHRGADRAAFEASLRPRRIWPVLNYD
ncbi:MAG: polysaccharide deacetylase family protein [Deltaproteobacteria bacterium]